MRILAIFVLAAVGTAWFWCIYSFLYRVSRTRVERRPSREDEEVIYDLDNQPDDLHASRHPLHLRGRAIGMWYKKRARLRKHQS